MLRLGKVILHVHRTLYSAHINLSILHAHAYPVLRKGGKKKDVLALAQDCKLSMDQYVVA